MSFFKKTTITCLIAVCTLTVNVFATNSNENIKENQNISNKKIYSEKPNKSVLFTNYNFNTHNGSYTTEKFIIPKGGKKVNLSFTSNSPQQCIVKLNKVTKTGTVEVGSFKVSPNKSDFRPFTVSQKENYEIRVVNLTGSQVKGSIKVRLL